MHMFDVILHMSFN